MKPAASLSYRGTVIVLFLFALIFSGCSSSPNQASPEATVQKYYQAMADNNIDAILSCLSLKAVDSRHLPVVRAAVQASTVMQQVVFRSQGGFKSVKTSIVKQEGNRAVVKAHITLGNGQTSEQELELVNEDGWKIHLGPISGISGL